MPVSGVCTGVLEASSGKNPGKLLDNFPVSRNALNSGISGTGKGPCADLPCGMFFEIDTHNLLEFF